MEKQYWPHFSHVSKTEQCQYSHLWKSGGITIWPDHPTMRHTCVNRNKKVGRERVNDGAISNHQATPLKQLYSAEDRSLVSYFSSALEYYYARDYGRDRFDSTASAGRRIPSASPIDLPESIPEYPLPSSTPLRGRR